MPLLNSAAGYGALTKLCHWSIVGLFAAQYVSAAMMLRTAPDGTTLGLAQAGLYNWHKSLGLVALAVTVVRLVNRRAGTLPPWATTLTPLEQAMIHRAEQLLYAAMLVMPVSGLIYSLAGGYGVRFFGLWDLPGPMTSFPAIATLARWVHVASGFALLLPLGLHVGLVLGHRWTLRDRLLDRMLPGRSPRE